MLEHFKHRLSSNLAQKTREVALRWYGQASSLKYVNGGYILFV